MKTKRISGDVASEVSLARRLSDCPSVTRLDDGDHREGWALAHALSDIEESSRALSDRLILALRAEGITDSEIVELLHDIGEELRQIIYHSRHVRYYDYLGAPAEAE